MFPTFSEVKWVKRSGDQSGLIYSRQKIPWPFDDRDLCFHISCIIDRKNQAILSLSKSIPIGQKYYGTPIPPEGDGCVRLEFNLCYNFF
jgi:hypothetical protein